MQMQLWVGERDDPPRPKAKGQRPRAKGQGECEAGYSKPWERSAAIRTTSALGCPFSRVVATVVLLLTPHTPFPAYPRHRGRTCTNMSCSRRSAVAEGKTSAESRDSQTEKDFWSKVPYPITESSSRKEVSEGQDLLQVMVVLQFAVRLIADTTVTDLHCDFCQSHRPISTPAGVFPPQC
ncbi:hypothetical protein K431DRAFT_78343 [Polychaeton citri CBS 116435]|uniref:Uncharacterized protein n=1 Tax=Polychaeton citri CBS 116435 TaxID=1314669 RepID=A0A9P4UU90_9PEZI|nr:hypothetical protein K431DRAFT_78343 [Polychaeton citri CBS 116435]